MMRSIREENDRDFAAIRQVNVRAFGGLEEADIVDKLRDSGSGVLSLVACHNDDVVGHIQFSPVVIEYEGAVIEGVGLGPMAVLPDYQYKGFGSALVEAGIEALIDRSYPFVVVLGHPEYYPRFGFAPASGRAISCQWPGIPDEAFMVRILDEEFMRNVHGPARYLEVFDAAE
jgi:putative acetyltransferase